jgi:hypothetical protein
MLRILVEDEVRIRREGRVARLGSPWLPGDKWSFCFWRRKPAGNCHGRTWNSFPSNPLQWISEIPQADAVQYEIFLFLQGAYMKSLLLHYLHHLLTFGLQLLISTSDR